MRSKRVKKTSFVMRISQVMLGLCAAVSALALQLNIMPNHANIEFAGIPPENYGAMNYDAPVGQPLVIASNVPAGIDQTMTGSISADGKAGDKVQNSERHTKSNCPN